MSIDWFTIIAQALNLLLLLWLMKRFLYKPVLHAVDEREKQIAQKLANGETEKKAAEELKEEYESRNGDLDRQRTALLKKAQDEGQTEKQRLLSEARLGADALSKKRHEALISEEKTLRKDVSQRIQKEVLSIVRKILTDLAGANLEEQMVGVFIKRLHNLDETEKKSLVSSLKIQPGTITLQTAFDISPELEKTTEDSIKEIVGMQANITIESSPDLICGIELLVNGKKVAWSMADYLSSLEEDLHNLSKKTGEGIKPESQEISQ